MVAVEEGVGEGEVDEDGAGWTRATSMGKEGLEHVEAKEADKRLIYESDRSDG